MVLTAISLFRSSSNNANSSSGLDDVITELYSVMSSWIKIDGGGEVVMRMSSCAFFQKKVSRGDVYAGLEST